MKNHFPSREKQPSRCTQDARDSCRWLKCDYFYGLMGASQPWTGCSVPPKGAWWERQLQRGLAGNPPECPSVAPSAKPHARSLPYCRSLILTCSLSASIPRVPHSCDWADLETSSVSLEHVRFLLWKLNTKTGGFKGSGNKGRCSEDFGGHIMLKE